MKLPSLSTSLSSDSKEWPPRLRSNERVRVREIEERHRHTNRTRITSIGTQEGHENVLIPHPQGWGDWRGNRRLGTPTQAPCSRQRAARLDFYMRGVLPPKWAWRILSGSNTPKWPLTLCPGVTGRVAPLRPGVFALAWTPDELPRNLLPFLEQQLALPVANSLPNCPIAR